MSATVADSPATYLTVQQLAQKQPGITEGSLRWALFHRRENGLDACVVRLGRKLLLDETRFLDWLDSQRERVE